MDVPRSKLHSARPVSIDGRAADRAKSVRAEEVRLLNIKAAAKYMGTTPKTLYGKVWRREIPFIKIGRSVRFDLRDLEELIEASKVKPHDARAKCP